MKKEYLLIIILAVIIIVLTAVLFMPTKNNKQTVIAPTTGILVVLPKAGQTYSSPLQITGVVSGNGWSGFEGQVGTVNVVDYQGNIVTTAVLKATTEWTTLPTKFEAILNFDIVGPVTLQFKNENPSGDPSKDKIFSLNVNLK